MWKRTTWTILTLAILCVPHLAFSETVELITYYPAAVDLNDIDAGSASVGDGYVAEAPINGVLIVEERIGVGTPNPQVDLDIYKQDETYLRVMGTGIAVAPENYAGIDIAADTDADGDEDTLWQLAHKRGGAGNQGDLHFNYFNGSFWRTRMVVQPDGDVGIGLAGVPQTPTATLDVGGTFNVVGDTTLANATVSGNLDVTQDMDLDGAIVLPHTTDANTGVIYKTTNRFIHNYQPGGAGGTLTRNLFVGESSGNFTMGANGGGHANIGVGQETLLNNDTGRMNIAIGNQAMRDNASGVNNIAIGQSARILVTSGRDNVAIGHSVMTRPAGDGNIALGTFALDGSTGSTSVTNANIAIGGNALRQHNADISENVAIGWGALQVINGGDNNVAIGHRAGRQVSGSGNVFIGHRVGETQNASNQLMIDNQDTADPLIEGDFAADTVTIHGNFGIGNTSFGGSASQNVLAFGNGVPPNATVLNHAFLFAEAGEMKAQDAFGNVTTLSPHNFALIPDGPSEPLAWSYHSERDGEAISVDMLKTVRLVESLSGEKLVYLSVPSETVGKISPKLLSSKELELENKRLSERLDQLEVQNEALLKRLETLEKNL